MDPLDHTFDQLLNAQLSVEGDTGPERVMVESVRRLTLSNGRTVQVKVFRPQDAAPWSDEDEAALRAILDVAAACIIPRRPKAPRLVS